MLLAQCPVCQELFTASSECVISALPCGHVFHQSCVNKWFRSKDTCPQCRKAVKRMNTVVRLFFDTVSDSYIGSMTHKDEKKGPGCSQSADSLNIELCKIRMESDRLEEALRCAEQTAEKNSKLAADRERENAILLSLYKESQKLYSVEQQRCRNLKTELASIRQFLHEAEDMKEEVTKLRGQLEEMKNIKKLISASEEATQDILSRYTQDDASKQDSSDPYSFESLCRLVAVLRTELTDARKKTRSYRDELSRVHKLQVSSSQRAAKAEAAVTEKSNYIRDLEEELEKLLNQKTHSREVIKTQQNKVPLASTSKVRLLSSPRSPCPSSCDVDLDNQTSRVFLSTPELIACDQENVPPTINLQRRMRTPNNPFRISDPIKKPKESGKRKTSPCDFSPSSSSPNSPLQRQEANSYKAPVRRPSSILEMSILRRQLHPCLRTSSAHSEHPVNHIIPVHSHSQPLKRVKFSSKSTLKLSRLDSFLPKQQ
ncbi:unnamed protein product [Calicophoron daubneyi]|uniref:RING-type domain-containing protein n=1 Tax=Calicophoron daubneyi TaxID=300641 RepID=A0AAV2SX50_CALDB